MDAGTLSVKRIFETDRRHIVPLFQRPYVWKQDDQWEPLWDDIRNVAERLVRGQATRPHFLGAIVLDQIRQPSGHVETRLVIDGQQRLTTIQLLLETFCDLCVAGGVERYDKALLKLTRNNDPMSNDPDEEFKVWPTNVDRDHFRLIMRAGSPDELRKAFGKARRSDAVGHAMADAYLFFHRAIGEWLGLGTEGADERIEALYASVRDHLSLVVIDLGKDDDAQLIFETLNARGAPLLPSDLVKNHIFHRLQTTGQDVDRLYNLHWKPFDTAHSYWLEEVGVGRQKKARIDLFLQHHVTVRKREEISVANLYQTIREHVDAEPANGTVEFLESLHVYADVFHSFDGFPSGSRECLFFQRLDAMDTFVAHPFLLELLRQHGSDLAEVRSVLVDVESFLVRRMICQLTTKSYNRLFVDLLRWITPGQAGIAKRIQQHLLAETSESARWPSDAEFRDAWLETPVYANLVRRRVRLVLEAIERQLHSDLSELVTFDEKLTIEHLLPQEWRKHWPLPEGVVDSNEAESSRERLLHTFGNLTLLNGKLNPTVSNGPWSDKRPAILEHSRLALNRRLQGSTDWSEARIRSRGEELFAVALQMWPRP